MITIDLLKNHPDAIPRLAAIWYEVLGKIWVPDISIQQVILRFQNHLNDNTLPLTIVAFDQSKPIGMCSLRVNDGIRPELMPWLGSLVVDPAHQGKGIGKLLVNATQDKAVELGFQKLYLFAFDPNIPKYYVKLGWSEIGIDVFKNHSVTVMEMIL